SYEVATHSNEEQYLVLTLVDMDGERIFFRLNWMVAADTHWYCVAMDYGSTVEEALAVSLPESDLGEGCYGSSWNPMVPTTDIRGIWTDWFGINFFIDSWVWKIGWSEYPSSSDAGFEVGTVDDDAMWVTIREEDGEWMRVDWFLETDSDTLRICTTNEFTDELDAILAPSSDRSDLSGGCDGYAWGSVRRELDISGYWRWETTDIYISEFSYQVDGGPFYSMVQFDNESETFLLENEDGDYAAMAWMWVGRGDLALCLLTDFVSSADVALSASVESYDLSETCATFRDGTESTWTVWETPSDTADTEPAVD
ncbi:MAG: hypothetical protein ACPGTU_12410, partial [Myxococcota bacterium]